jgi:trimethylamine:corrinoid methyltransferase-like protein
MVLDNEFLSALKSYTREFEISPQAIGLDTIFDTGPGGHYMDKHHTADHFRQEHWEPALWSRQMLQSWLEGGCKLDVDRARQFILDLAGFAVPPSPLPEIFEREFLRIVERAKTS